MFRKPWLNLHYKCSGYDEAVKGPKCTLTSVALIPYSITRYMRQIKLADAAAIQAIEGPHFPRKVKQKIHDIDGRRGSLIPHQSPYPYHDVSARVISF